MIQNNALYALTNFLYGASVIALFIAVICIYGFFSNLSLNPGVSPRTLLISIVIFVISVPIFGFTYANRHISQPLIRPSLAAEDKSAKNTVEDVMDEITYNTDIEVDCYANMRTVPLGVSKDVDGYLNLFKNSKTNGFAFDVKYGGSYYSMYILNFHPHKGSDYLYIVPTTENNKFKYLICFKPSIILNALSEYRTITLEQIYYSDCDEARDLSSESGDFLVIYGNGH